MDLLIRTARDGHNVRSEAALRAKHVADMARKVAHGQRLIRHDDPTPTPVRVDHGRWILDCACGSGALADPAWSIACCFACGAVHTALVWPADREAIERVLLARPQTKTRQWSPGESLADLEAENVAHGIRTREE